MKENNASKVFLFFWIHVCKQSIPESEIKQELSTMARIDGIALFILTLYTVHEKLEMLTDICQDHVG